jgi:predicted Rossmann fold nucleotide-binding protein DprA/Smf involved in DNA uptake
MRLPLAVNVIESRSSDCPALRNGTTSALFPRIWSIGNLQILKCRLLAFFCSIKCPGEAIVRTYDLARELRDASVPVIGGFHSPMEKECLELLLRGKQPVVICPARSIERMRIPISWRPALADQRLLVASPFESKHHRATEVLAEQRNRFVALLADSIFIAHAAPQSKTERFCQDFIELGKQVFFLDCCANATLVRLGAKELSLGQLTEHLLGTLGLAANSG